MGRKYITDTQIAPIVDVGTYAGPFSYEGLWAGEEEAEREEGRLVCQDYDPKKMGSRIVEEANGVFGQDKPLRDYGVVAIRATRFGSPREYNFMSDWLDLEVEVDDSFFAKARKAIFDPENRATIVAVAKDYWVSRDGHISDMLNRTQYLSRDMWKAKHYGRHLSTDDEIYEALLADLDEAISALDAETSENERQEMGAVLALLWYIEYADEDVMTWVTDEMVEHLRGNSSLSEFCTVLDRDEVREKFGGHMVDFDDFIADRRDECSKYGHAEFPDPESAKRAADRYIERLTKAVDALRSEQDGLIELYMPDEERVKAELDEFRTGKWGPMVLSGFDQKFWKEDDNDV